MLPNEVQRDWVHLLRSAPSGLMQKVIAVETQLYNKGLPNFGKPLLYMARPEGVEPTTAWFVVRKLIANILFFNIDYWSARYPFCLTMQDDA